MTVFGKRWDATIEAMKRKAGHPSIIGKILEAHGRDVFTSHRAFHLELPLERAALKHIAHYSPDALLKLSNVLKFFAKGGSPNEYKGPDKSQIGIESRISPLSWYHEWHPRVLLSGGAIQVPVRMMWGEGRTSIFVGQSETKIGFAIHEDGTVDIFSEPGLKGQLGKEIAVAKKLFKPLGLKWEEHKQNFEPM
ncbi:MAG: hypothetical protein AABX01_02190 [Candidatus Micrarchaeota archaeon]